MVWWFTMFTYVRFWFPCIQWSFLAKENENEQKTVLFHLDFDWFIALLMHKIEEIWISSPPPPLGKVCMCVCVGEGGVVGGSLTPL